MHLVVSFVVPVSIKRFVLVIVVTTTGQGTRKTTSVGGGRRSGENFGSVRIEDLSQVRGCVREV